MPLRNYTTLSTLAIVATVLGAAQSKTQFDVVVPLGHNASWKEAQVEGAFMRKLAVVTVDHPDRRQSCRVKSFTPEKLVCSRVLGGPRTYSLDQVVAIIIPGDGGSRLPIWLGLNAGLGASIWGTVVLTATCPPCAAATAVAALFFFSAAGATAYADDVPDRLLYIAPGQQLSGKLGYVQDRNKHRSPRHRA